MTTQHVTDTVEQWYRNGRLDPLQPVSRGIVAAVWSLCDLPTGKAPAMRERS